MNIKKLYICSIVLIFFLAGCVSVSAPSIKYYALLRSKIGKHYNKNYCHKKKSIMVYDFSIVQRYSSLSFLYRVSNVRFINDYYNSFLNQPAEEIKNNFIYFLTNYSGFAFVTDDASFQNVDYNLHAKILELYGDYRNRNNPKAVVEIRFVLSDKNNKVILDKIVKSAVVIKRKNSRSFVVAMSTALRRVYITISSDIDRAVMLGSCK